MSKDELIETNTFTDLCSLRLVPTKRVYAYFILSLGI